MFIGFVGENTDGQQIQPNKRLIILPQQGLRAAKRYTTVNRAFPSNILCYIRTLSQS